MKVRAFITHKLSEHYAECQDRFSINASHRTIALSDGMSQSIFPDYWADILSKFYADNGHCSNDDRIKLCETWLAKVTSYLHNEKVEGRNPWRLQNNLAAYNGAGATICGLTFDDSNNWHGHVLGDSCIIEVNVEDPDNPFVNKIYTSEEKPFDSYPDYYESFPSKTGRGEIKSINGTLTNHNTILLVSDPFSEYLSKYKDKEESSVWLKRIMSLKSHEGFCSLVDDWRCEGLHNDDSTLCIIEYDGAEALTIEFEDNIENLIQLEKSLTNEEENNDVEEIIDSEVDNAEDFILTSLQEKSEFTVLASKEYPKEEILNINTSEDDAETNTPVIVSCDEEEMSTGAVQSSECESNIDNFVNQFNEIVENQRTRSECEELRDFIDTLEKRKNELIKEMPKQEINRGRKKKHNKNKVLYVPLQCVENSFSSFIEDSLSYIKIIFKK